MLSKIRHIFKCIRARILVLSDPNELTGTTRRENVKITEITFDNVDRVKDFRSEDFADTFRRFLRAGNIGVYAWRDSKVVGHLWGEICRQRSCGVHGYLDISQGEALILYDNVSKGCRGLGIFKSMLSTLCQLLFARAKVHRILADSWVDNIPSSRGFEKVGFKPLGIGVYFQFCGHLLLKFFKPFEKHVNLEIINERRREEDAK